MRNYYLLAPTRGYFLAELGPDDKAAAAFELARSQTANESQRRFFAQLATVPRV